VLPSLKKPNYQRVKAILSVAWTDKIEQRKPWQTQTVKEALKFLAFFRHSAETLKTYPAD
jgi:hypothetical protein